MNKSDPLEKAKNEIAKAINPIRLGAVIGLLSAIYESYRFFSQGDFQALRIVGAIVTLIIGGALFFTTVLLKRESKHALTVAAFAIGLGIIRWVVIDKAFTFNIMSIVLLGVFAGFLGQFVRWIRAGALR
jgi:hypothetical protein